MVLYRSADYESIETDGMSKEREDFNHIYFDQMSSGDTSEDYCVLWFCPGSNI